MVELTSSRVAATIPLGRQLAVTPIVAFGSSESEGTFFNLGGQFHFELGRSTTLQPYLGAELLYGHNALDFEDPDAVEGTTVPHSLSGGPVAGVRWFPTPRLGVLAEAAYACSTLHTQGDSTWGRATIDAHSWVQATVGVTIRLGSLAAKEKTAP